MVLFVVRSCVTEHAQRQPAGDQAVLLYAGLAFGVCYA